VTDILRSPKAWGPVFVVGALLAFLYFLVNFGAAKSPATNTRDLPVALVNADAGAEVGGQRADLGARVAESATTSEEIGDRVEWTHLSSRQQALEGIANGKYYGALVIPEGYSAAVAGLSEQVEDGSLKPARIEVLTNPSAGPFSSATVQQILTGVVQEASEATAAQVIDVLQASGVRVSPAAAAVLGEPVVAEVTDAQPVGENSARGLMPFYLTFLAMVLGFIGANAIHGGVDTLTEGIAARVGQAPSRTRLFAARVILGFVLALLVGAVEALVAFGIYGVHHETSSLYILLFLALIASVSLFAALVLLVAFGPRAGILSGSFLILSVGLATSGGTTPVQNLPDFLRSLSDVLPFEHATEGIRALLFYDGRLEAGLGTAMWILTAYLAGTLVLGVAISLARDAVAQRRRSVWGSGLSPKPKATAAPSTAATGRIRRED
jgi:YhgE/Pip-like protein